MIKKIISIVLLSILVLFFFSASSNKSAIANQTDVNTTKFNIRGSNENNLYDKNGKQILKPSQKGQYSVITLDPSLNERTAELPLGTIIFLYFPSGEYTVNISPDKGIVEKAKGKYHLPKGDIAILKVVGKGTATITVTKIIGLGKSPVVNAASSSANWSGYARTTGGPFTNITSTWTVPTATSCASGDTYSSAWIGIDGATNSDLIQTGTESDCISGSPFYQAWWEILPAAEQPITGYSVNAGDQMYAEIKKISTYWTITIKNLTQNWTYSPSNQTYSGSQSSAEWILERPQVNGSLATLTDYGNTSFLNDTQNGANPNHLYSTDSIDMIVNLATISAVSTQNYNTNGFSVAYGSTAPASPSASWTNTGSLHNPLGEQTSTLLSSGKILNAGGVYNGITYSYSELYNPTTKTWSNTGNLIRARRNHKVHLVTISGGEIRAFAIGGYSTQTPIGPLSSTELYNETSGTWYSAANMNVKRAGHASVMLADGTILVMGGDIVGNNSTTRSAELYDPINNIWTVKANLNTARQSHTATLLNDGRVLVTGGANGSTALSSTEIYDPTSDTWSTGPTMAYARAAHTATLLPNGKVLIAGGSGTASTKTEIFDPSNNTLSNAQSSNYAHSGHTATLITLSDGVTQKILVIGTNGLTNQAELYDYINNSWSVTNNMNTSRIQFGVAKLNNGNVLISGGRISSGYTTSAEYYAAP